MQLDSDDLLARMRRDWPDQYESTRLNFLVEKQAERIAELEQEQAR